ncbi:hypothetical protein OTU49_013610 [Cherax quadricarinatus]|uniref:Protein kinase domain-containing protein n=1 Tax=Cherax quadricarinatus TaxID=27406 RepID=A0AAW0VT46_CHEQU
MAGDSKKRSRSSFPSEPASKRVKVCNAEAGGSQHRPPKTKKKFRKFSWSQISLKSEIGEGAFAKTHRAQVTMDDGSIVIVAVKVFETQQYDMTECRLLKAAAGAGGAPKFFGISKGLPSAIIMELCPGQPLDEFFECNPVYECKKAYEAVKIALLDFHAKGFTHQDLHPGNILIDRVDNKYVAHLIDLG